MWGSAAVIGLQMLPILGRADDSIRWDVARAARHRPGHRVPADQLHPRHRRGPAPRTRLPAAGVARHVRRRPRAARPRPGGRADPQPARLRDRAGPRAVRAGRRRASTSSTRPRGTACAPRSRSTAASSTRSSAPTTTCSAAGSAWRSAPAGVAARGSSALVGAARCLAARARRPEPHPQSTASAVTIAKPNSRSSTGAYDDPQADDRRGVVAHDGSPVSSAVHDQLEEQHDRVRRPERLAPQQIRPRNRPGRRGGADHAEHREHCVASPSRRRSSTVDARARTASRVSTAQVGITRKNSNSSSGSRPGSVHARRGSAGRSATSCVDGRRCPTRRRRTTTGTRRSDQSPPPRVHPGAQDELQRQRCRAGRRRGSEHR